MNITSSPTKLGKRQRWAHKRENSIFMWIKRPWFIILKMANIKRVTARHPMSTKQAVRVTPSANALSLSSISGIGRGVGVVGGGTNGCRMEMEKYSRCIYSITITVKHVYMRGNDISVLPIQRPPSSTKPIWHSHSYTGFVALLLSVHFAPSGQGNTSQGP